MATSEHKAYIKCNKSHATKDSSVSVSVVRAKIINNLNHLADEAAQVRVKYISPIGGAGLLPIEDAALRADVGYPLFSTRFPVTVRPDGDSYVLRVRLAGHVQAGFQGGTATFKCVIGSVADVDGRPADQTVTATNALTTVSTAWLDGAAVDKTYITVPSSSVADSWVDEAVVEDKASANKRAGTISWALMSVIVTGATSVNDSKANLRGLLIEEFVGL